MWSKVIVSQRNQVLKKALDANKKQNLFYKKNLSKERKFPKILTNRSSFTKIETENERMNRLLPKIGLNTIKIGSTPGQLKNMDLHTLGFFDLWQACVHPVQVPHWSPQWADNSIGNGSWNTWENHAGHEVEFLAYTCGDGSADQDFCLHMARFEWYFVAEHNENLNAWIQFSMTGPSAYRLNGGDLAIWIISDLGVGHYDILRGRNQILKPHDQ